MVVGMERHDFDVVLTFIDGDGDGGVVVPTGMEVRIDVLEVDLALGQEVAVRPREVLRRRQPWWRLIRLKLLKDPFYAVYPVFCRHYSGLRLKHLMLSPTFLAIECGWVLVTNE